MRTVRPWEISYTPGSKFSSVPFPSGPVLTSLTLWPSAALDFGYFISDSHGEIRLHEKGKKLYPGEFTVTEVEPAPGFQMKEPTTQKVILHRE